MLVRVGFGLSTLVLCSPPSALAALVATVVGVVCIWRIVREV